MTRETRIGLLVGLAFIVMFGLVLGDLAGTSPPPAEGDGIALREAKQEWSPVIDPPGVPVIAPVPLAATEKKVSGDRPDESVVRSGPPVPENPAPEKAVSAETLTPTLIRQSPPPRRTYTVQPGDSLRRIARNVYGPEHEELYIRIFNANRDILQDESLVYVGQELVVPPLCERDGEPRNCPKPTLVKVPQRTIPPVPGRHYREMDLGQLREYFSSGGGSELSAQRTHVVREGDNLTNIAREMLNDDSGSAVNRIYHANRDLLDSPDILPVGVRLRIPD